MESQEYKLINRDENQNKIKPKHKVVSDNQRRIVVFHGIQISAYH